VGNQSLIDLLNYLSGQPSMDRLAQFLVLDVFPQHDPRGALISAFDSQGSVHALGSFGLEQDVMRGLQHLSLWDRAPVVDSIREGQILVLVNGDAVQDHYPWLTEHESLLQATVAWPLMLGNQRLGAVQLNFGAPLETEALLALGNDVMPVIALYVEMSVYSQAHNGSASANGHMPTEAQHAAPNGNGQLSERQRLILRMLAQGMTNPQIASRIGFSDSTVRQETMAIYRHLGATGRREAARIAAMRGLLTAEATPV
jgi:DNA-binding CsgD family transcriptional regulator